MKSALAVYRDGQIVLNSPVDWPEGTIIEVRPLAKHCSEGNPPEQAPPNVRQEFFDALHRPEACCLSDSFWPLSPEEIRLLVAHMDAAEPLLFGPEEQSRMEADREFQKEIHKQQMRERWNELDRMLQ